MRKSNPSFPSQMTFGVRRMPRVLLIQLTNPPDPAQRNWTSSSYSDTAAPRPRASLRM